MLRWFISCKYEVMLYSTREGAKRRIKRKRNFSTFQGSKPEKELQHLSTLLILQNSSMKLLYNFFFFFLLHPPGTIHSWKPANAKSFDIISAWLTLNYKVSSLLLKALSDLGFKTLLAIRAALAWPYPPFPSAGRVCHAYNTRREDIT